MCTWNNTVNISKTLLGDLHQKHVPLSHAVVFPCINRSKVNIPSWFSPVSEYIVSLYLMLPEVFFRRLPCVFRLTTDQPVMSLLSPLQRYNLRHLVILGARPRQCWVKPTPWAGARGWLTDRNSTRYADLNLLQGLDTCMFSCCQTHSRYTSDPHMHLGR